MLFSALARDFILLCEKLQTCYVSFHKLCFLRQIFLRPLLGLTEYVAIKGSGVLGEHNYSSYKAEDAKNRVHEAEASGFTSVTAPFESEIARAYLLADEVVLNVDELYTQLRLGHRIELEPLSELLSLCVRSIKKNVYAWLFLCQVKNPESYLVEHAYRTSILSMCLGLREGLNDRQLVELGLAAILSDVGKIMIPSAILEKEGALSSAEYAVIQVHPLEGRKILLAQTDASAALIEVVVSHHEQIDGEGYPAKLSADEIPHFAKIIAIADAFDAMTSQRSYAPARSFKDAASILWSCCDKQFDATLIERFLAMLGCFPPGTQVGIANSDVAIVLEPADETMTEWTVACFDSSGSSAQIHCVTKDAGRSDKRYISSIEPTVAGGKALKELRKQFLQSLDAHSSVSNINN